jgi:hypothetical protein
VSGHGWRGRCRCAACSGSGFAGISKILLIRHGHGHGHVDGIKPERFRGRELLNLAARGRAEAACRTTLCRTTLCRIDAWNPQSLRSFFVGAICWQSTEQTT